MNIAGPAWRALETEELRLLTTIASQIGIAVERARLAEESTRLARAEERNRLSTRMVGSFLRRRGKRWGSGSTACWS